MTPRRSPGVDRDGLRVPRGVHGHVDVRLDGRRVWSFRPDDEGDRAWTGGTLVAWPTSLRPFLVGTAEVVLRDAVGATLHTEEVDFGGSGRVSVADDQGRPLVLDEKGRLTLPFESGERADGDQKGPLLAAARVVVDALEGAGVEPFLAYGTLLGAVREGDFISHDNDVDIGYLGRFSEPVDVVRESLRVERTMRDAGLRIDHRYSGGGFKVIVVDAAGVERGLDVFAGFMRDGQLGLLGEILTPFRREWLVPRSTVTLAGEPFPAPAEPAKLLAATYGPGWRVPDPTFGYDQETSAHLRLGGWFRGLREQRNKWERWYSRSWEQDPLRRPHELARMVHRRRPGAFVVDVGCGRGQDACWLADRGHDVWAFDYTERAYHYLARESAERGLPVRFHPTNLLSLRHTMAWGARLARVEGDKVLLARHVVDCVSRRGRLGLLQMARTGLRGGGVLFLELFVDDGRREPEQGDLIWGVDVDELEAEIAEAGGRVLWRTDFTPQGPHELPSGSASWDPVPQARRMAVQW